MLFFEAAVSSGCAAAGEPGASCRHFPLAGLTLEGGGGGVAEDKAAKETAAGLARLRGSGLGSWLVWRGGYYARDA